MGRHSAPEDDEDDRAPGGTTATQDPGPATGRHARIDAPVVEDPVAPAVGARDRAFGTIRRHSGESAADLALVRERPAVRNRCIAALLVPFALYAVVLVVLGPSGRQWLYWLWIPIVVAGVGVGAVLDAGHRSRPEPPPGD